MRLLNVERSIMYNLYKDFHSAFFIYDIQRILIKHKVNNNIYNLLKATSDIRKKYNFDVRKYV